MDDEEKTLMKIRNLVVKFELAGHRDYSEEDSDDLSYKYK